MRTLRLSDAEATEAPLNTLVVEFVDEHNQPPWSSPEDVLSAHLKMQVNLGDPSLSADLLATLKQAGLVFALVLRGRCPPLLLLVDICLIFQSSLRSLELDMFASPPGDPAANPEYQHVQDGELPLVSGNSGGTHLTLRRLSCTLARRGLRWAGACSAGFLQWLVSSGSCAGLENMSFAILNSSYSSEISISKYMRMINTLLYAANGSLQRFEAINYPAVIQSGASASLSSRCFRRKSAIRRGWSETQPPRRVH